MTSIVRPTSPARPRTEADPLASARALARLLDSAVRIPGTSITFGVDALAGLIPGIGDIAGAVLSGYIILVGVRLGAPTPVIVRMLGNLAIDTAVGAVPVLGDAFDVAWRANQRNVALLEAHIGRPAEAARRSRRGLWLVGVALVVLIVAVVALAVLGIRVLARRAG